jgi:hypothetical protein
VFQQAATQNQQPVHEPVQHVAPRFTSPVPQTAGNRYTQATNPPVKQTRQAQQPVGTRYTSPVHQTAGPQYTSPVQQTTGPQYTSPVQQAVSPQYTAPVQQTDGTQYTYDSNPPTERQHPYVYQPRAKNTVQASQNYLGNEMAPHAPRTSVRQSTMDSLFSGVKEAVVSDLRKQKSNDHLV